MTRRDLYTLLHLLHAFAEDHGLDTPEYLAVLVLTMSVEKELTQKPEVG